MGIQAWKPLLVYFGVWKLLTLIFPAIYFHKTLPFITNSWFQQHQVRDIPQRLQYTQNSYISENIQELKEVTKVHCHETPSLQKTHLVGENFLQVDFIIRKHVMKYQAYKYEMFFFSFKKTR